MEGFIFAYLGVTFLFYWDTEFEWSWELLAFEFMAIVVGRFCGILICMYMLMICKHKPVLCFKEIIFIAFSGLIRGSISLALIFSI
jgi:NhaP-type Na+/H+ or K+/H+ antiporter